MSSFAKIAAGLLVVAASSLSTAATANPLNGDQIKELISGKRVYLSTPLRIELPLLYRNDGSVVGDISGFSMASMFAPKEKGRWWVENEQLCQQWPSWYKGKQFCFRIKQLSDTKIAWTRDDNYTGTARIGN